MKEVMLYRIEGTVDGNKYDFYIYQRMKPPIPYERALRNYRKQYKSCDDLWEAAEEGINELFTKRQAAAFCTYFEKHFGPLTVQQQRLPLGLFAACRRAFQLKNLGIFWDIFNDRRYDLNFHVRGYCCKEPATSRLLVRKKTMDVEALVNQLPNY